jgi:PBP1b-binding outer membrane lipoprotein LpoB
VRHSTITLIVALTATFFAGCGSSPSTVNTSQEVAHVKPVSDQKPAKKPAQFNKTAPKSEKYPFEVTSKNDTSEAGKVTITVTNTTNQPAGPLDIEFNGRLGGQDVNSAPQIETSDHRKVDPGLKNSVAKLFYVKVLEPGASYTIRTYYPEGTCVQAIARLLNQPNLNPALGASSCDS